MSSWYAAMVRLFERQMEKNLSSMVDALYRAYNNVSPQEQALREMRVRAGPDPPVGIQPPAGSVGIGSSLGLLQADAQAAAPAAANSMARGTAAAAGSVSNFIDQPSLPPPQAGSGVSGPYLNVLATAAGAGGIIPSAATNTALAAVSGAGRNLLPAQLLREMAASAAESGDGVLVPNNELIRIIASAMAAPDRAPSVSGGGGGVPPEVLGTVPTTGGDGIDLPSNGAVGAADRLQDGVQATPSYFTNAAIAVTLAVLVRVAAVGGLAYVLRLDRVGRGGMSNLKKRKRGGEDEDGGGTGGGGGTGNPVVSM